MARVRRVQRTNNNLARRSLDYSAYYAHDSTARQIADKQELTPRTRVSRKKNTKQKQEFVLDIQARHRQNLLSYAIVFVFFGCLAIVLSLNANLVYNKSHIEAARAELAALQEINAALTGEIYAQLDLDEIERIAIQELGFGVGEEFQFMEITVRPQSFFSHVSNDEPLTGRLMLANFWNTLFSFTASQ